MKTQSTKRRKLPESFDALCRLHPLRPIQDKIDFENAQEIADALAVLDERSKDQNDFLETLATLMERYEDKHNEFDTSRLDPIGTLKYLMSGHDMTASDLGRLLGHRELGPAILRGGRQLSKSHILTLSKHFGVGVGVLLKG
jgi:antitoxin component HigA of HigAB toxin-antitoxin module